MGGLNIQPEKHHSGNKTALKQYAQLIGIDDQKQQLLSNLELIMNPKSLDSWQKKFHPDGLAMLDYGLKLSRLIILSGDVGCGKSELAGCIGSKLSEKLDDSEVYVFHAPSDLRGTGMVGQLSARITALFETAKSNKKYKYALIVIDEADDVTNSRENDQQHHEDRSGVNALIKELDGLNNESTEIAVIFISNRLNTFDPAIMRRSAMEIHFNRPNEPGIRDILNCIAGGIDMNDAQVNQLVKSCLAKKPLFTYSDFFKRIGIKNVVRSKTENRPLCFDDFLKSIETTVPSPQFKQHENE
jgi:SpoVK/Ycf46/Vps4 family AAA+-type ATPase